MQRRIFCPSPGERQQRGSWQPAFLATRHTEAGPPAAVALVSEVGLDVRCPGLCHPEQRAPRASSSSRSDLHHLEEDEESLRITPDHRSAVEEGNRGLGEESGKDHGRDRHHGDLWTEEDLHHPPGSIKVSELRSCRGQLHSRAARKGLLARSCGCQAAGACRRCPTGQSIWSSSPRQRSSAATSRSRSRSSLDWAPTSTSTHDGDGCVQYHP